MLLFRLSIKFTLICVLVLHIFFNKNNLFNRTLSKLNELCNSITITFISKLFCVYIENFKVLK